MREQQQSLFLQQYNSISAIWNIKLPFFKRKDKSQWRSYYEDDKNPNEFITADFLWQRELTGRSTIKAADLVRAHRTRMPALMEEREFELNGHDKVFSSAWISDNQVVIGTKSNKLVIIETDSSRQLAMPVVTSKPDEFSTKVSGIYGLAVNPSKTLLAACTGINCKITVYRLPGFEPVASLEGHTDLIFSLTWISDLCIVSSARNHFVGMWSLESIDEMRSPFENNMNIPVIEHTIMHREHMAKVRSIQYNAHKENLFTLGGDGTARLWDINRLTYSKEIYFLDQTSEAVCTSQDATKNLYAIGSQKCITLIDPRIPGGLVHDIESADEGFGVRSLAWNSNILTIGGGLGRLSFYDLRTQNYLHVVRDDKPLAEEKAHEKWAGNYRRTGAGWLCHDTMQRSYFSNQTIPNAVYTMAYDASGSRLFTGGGPLQMCLRGSYAAVWE
eukprot:Partr_v1_DN26789_c3_g1_i4_m8598 putative ddb1 and cul4 associated factor